MRLTVFQGIGVVGIVLVFVGGILAVVLPQMSATGTSPYTGLGMILFGLGGLLIVVGVIGGFMLAIRQAGERRGRERTGTLPPGR